MRKFLLYLPLFYASAAAADSWHYIATPVASKTFVNVSSIQRRHDWAAFWDKTVYGTSQKISGAKAYTQMNTLGLVNCQKHTMASAYYALYNRAGRLLDLIKGPGIFRTVDRGTPAYRIVSLVCGAPARPAILHAEHHQRSSPATRKAEYVALIDRLVSQLPVDRRLVYAVTSVESGFNPNAVSPAGAVGLMQLMPDTARRFGVKNIWDPVENIRAGAEYLHYLLQLFNQNVTLAVAAYNAGEKAVIKYGNRIPPYKETQSYVPKVLNLYYQHKG